MEIMRSPSPFRLSFSGQLFRAVARANKRGGIHQSVEIVKKPGSNLAGRGCDGSTRIIDNAPLFPPRRAGDLHSKHENADDENWRTGIRNYPRKLRGLTRSCCPATMPNIDYSCGKCYSIRRLNICRVCTYNAVFRVRFWNTDTIKDSPMR